MLDRGKPYSAQVLQFSERAPRAGMAIRSRRAALAACNDAQRHPDAAVLPPPVRAALAINCAGVAQAVLARSPTDSFAWVIVAGEHARRGEPDVAFQALGNSQRLAPAELWIAAERVRIAEPLNRQMGPAARAAHDADLLIMLQSRQGVRTMAALWLANPEFRKRVTALADTLDRPEQRRFLGTVRALTVERQLQ